MKKIIISFALLSVFLISLAGCTSEELGKLIRIDVFNSMQKETHIQDLDTLALVEKLSAKIKWEPNKIPSMAREADVRLVLFYEVEKNMPEKVTEYEIWFNEGVGTVTIISNDEKEGYGVLDKENATTLKNILIE